MWDILYQRGKGAGLVMNVNGPSARPNKYLCVQIESLKMLII